MSTYRSRWKAFAVLGLGLALLLFGSWSGAQYRYSTLFSPFFFSPSGMALSPEGAVLVGVQDSRIHIYRDDGIFVSGWGLSPIDGAIRLRTQGMDGVEIARQGDDTVSLYDYRGGLLEAREDPGAFEAFGSEHDRRIPGLSGEAFEIGPNGLSFISGEQSRLIVSVPKWPLSLFGSAPMIPVALVMTVGALLILVGALMTADLRRSDA